MAQFQSDPTLDPFEPEIENRVELETESTPQATPKAEAAPADLHELPLPVPSLTNSPQCAPAQRPRTIKPSRLSPSKNPISSSPSSTPPPPRSPRRARTVRVDAWAVPASTNWSRTRASARKVNRNTGTTDWALPF
jgi:hypothetical protein